MSKFLNTSGINYFLEELIKSSNERVILISPFLKFNNRIKELFEDKNRLKIPKSTTYFCQSEEFEIPRLDFGLKRWLCTPNGCQFELKWLEKVKNVKKSGNC